MSRTTEPALLRLLTYNIHGCIGAGGRYDYRAILRLLDEIDADVVALQEVYDERPKDRQFLAALRQTPYTEIEYGRTLRHESRGDYGNVLLSKWPLSRVERIDLSVDDYEPRGAIRAEVQLPHRTIDLTTTHLGLKGRERAAQIEILRQRWQLEKRRIDRSAPFVFMGDLNEWRPGRNILSTLNRAIAPSPHLRTFPAAQPAFALDRIYVRPNRLVKRIEVVNTRLAKQASDHLPLLVDLNLSSQPSRPVV